MSNIPSAKECAEHGVKQELKSFYSTLGLAFHPDTDFADYISNADDKPIFSKRTAKKLNARLDECFDMCEKYELDIYGLAIEVSKDFPFVGASPNLQP
jgi:hypothetical protein